MAVQARLPRGVFAYQRLLVMNSLPLAHLVRPEKPLPLLEGKKRKEAQNAIMREQMHA